MKTFFFLLIIFLVPQRDNFIHSQLKNARVRTAKAQKDSIVKQLFESGGLEYPPKNIFFRVFKSEALLELWAFNDNENKYNHIKTYDICALSGELGPKRRRGDLQIPEGFYHINHFNPASNFYLSLKLNYPNKSDKILGYRVDLGGDIFIHGDCVTIGCMPITDEFIKELYWIAVQAKEKGQNRIPVHIFPTKLNENNFGRLKLNYEHKSDLLEFWKNLKIGYDYFEKYKVLPKINVDSSGKYIFKSSGY